jgi:hypothetical protein
VDAVGRGNWLGARRIQAAEKAHTLHRKPDEGRNPGLIPKWCQKSDPNWPVAH